MKPRLDQRTPRSYLDLFQGNVDVTRQGFAMEEVIITGRSHSFVPVLSLLFSLVKVFFR